MAKGLRKEATYGSPVSAANYVRRCAGAMLAGGESRHKQYAAERNCLREWFARHGHILNKTFCSQFGPVSSGAEHRVYYDLAAHRAIKATHPNRFGHSVLAEGMQANPLEYLKRLICHNLLFGDDTSIAGMYRRRGPV